MASTVQIVDANLREPNVLCDGFCCHRVVGVSFLERDRHECVVFLDCRPMLQGWAIELNRDGRISHADLVDWLETFAPAGWQSQVTRASIDGGMLITAHGDVP